MRSLFAILLISLVIPTSQAHEQNNESKYKKIKQQIKQIESKMRAGCTRSQEEKLNASLWKLRAERAKTCRLCRLPGSAQGCADIFKA